jgi:membrane protease YdiL (CAAX protease family)
MLNVSSKKVRQALLTNKHPQAAPWPASRALIGVILAFFLAQMLGGVVLMMYPQVLGWNQARIDDWLTNSAGAQFIYVIITEAMTLLVLWLFWRKYKAHTVREALGLHRWPRWKDLGHALLGIVVYLGLYMVFFGIINALVPVDTSQNQAVGFDHAKGGALIMAFISLVILPPIVEEITFRGFLFSGLKRQFGVLGAALLTSLLFAAPHLLTGEDSLLWVAAIDTFALSLVLCYLREKTGSLYASMVVHALKNSIAFMALFIFVK